MNVKFRRRRARAGDGRNPGVGLQPVAAVARASCRGRRHRSKSLHDPHREGRVNEHTRHRPAACLEAEPRNMMKKAGTSTTSGAALNGSEEGHRVAREADARVSVPGGGAEEEVHHVTTEATIRLSESGQGSWRPGLGVEGTSRDHPVVVGVTSGGTRARGRPSGSSGREAGPNSQTKGREPRRTSRTTRRRRAAPAPPRPPPARRPSTGPSPRRSPSRESGEDRLIDKRRSKHRAVRLVQDRRPGRT